MFLSPGKTAAPRVRGLRRLLSITSPRFWLHAVSATWTKEFAALVAIAFQGGRDMRSGWQVFADIVSLLFISTSTGSYEERNAGNVVKASMNWMCPRIFTIEALRSVPNAMSTCPPTG